MATLQSTDIETYKQLSDFVSSYYDALTETDGETYWLASNGLRESGLRIDGEALRLGRRHKLRFTLQKVSGDLVTIGGSIPMAYDIRIKIDGRKRAGVWEDGIMWPDDLLAHRVEVSFTVVDRLEPLMNLYAYILPNRLADTTCQFPTYRAELTQLGLEVIGL